MPSLSPERREEKYRQMRERQRHLHEIREKLLPGGIGSHTVKAAVTPQGPRRAMPQEWGKMVRVNQAAQELGVSRQTVVRWFRDRAVVVPGAKREMILIPRSVLEDFLREHFHH